MLEKPRAGWSTFKLEGTNGYDLSFLDDIAFLWLDEAIHGLETMQPFCVKGFTEPWRFLCAVSYWNCHIIYEDDRRYPLSPEDVVYENAHISMLQFCRYLYDDIKESFDEWISFPCCELDDEDIKYRQKLMTQKLEQLHALISEKEERFDENRCFL